MSTAKVRERGPSLVRNTSALFAAQAVSMAAPLLTVPYLARVLGPEGWAPIVAAQALANWLIVLLEYGFDLSGTRAVAQARAAPETMSEVVSGVQGAKLLLVPFAALVVLAVFLVMPALRGRTRLLEWTLAYAVFRGLNPFWFFQGLERVQAAVTVEAITKVAAAVGVIVLVAGPADGWRVLALQAVFAGVSLLVLTLWMARAVKLRRPAIKRTFATMHGTAGIFGMRAASGVYNQASVLILASLANAATVSYFGGAERIVRASVSLLQPLTQAFLPRLSLLSIADPREAKRTVERCLLAIGALGAVFGLGALLGAPFLTRVLLGPSFAPATAVVRMLSPLPVLVAVNTVLAFYWAVPFGHDRRLLISVLWAGAVNIAAALILVPRFGAPGMAAAVVAAECAVTISLGSDYLGHRDRVSPRSSSVPS